MKTTAVQKMIGYIEERFDLTEEEMTKLKDLLVEEMEQIYDAFVSGDNRGIGNIPLNCEQYYSQTYKN